MYSLAPTVIETGSFRGLVNDSIAVFVFQNYLFAQTERIAKILGLLIAAENVSDRCLLLYNSLLSNAENND